MRILTEMDNQNVIKVFKIYEDKNYCEGGELFNHEEKSCYFFCRMINGIESIYPKSIAHRDLIHKNLLIGKNKVLKTTDFGPSNFYDDQKRLKNLMQFPLLFITGNEKKYDGFNIDVWLLVLFYLLCYVGIHYLKMMKTIMMFYLAKLLKIQLIILLF